MKISKLLFLNQLLCGSQWLRIHYSRFCKETNQGSRQMRCCRLGAVPYQIVVKHSTDNMLDFSVLPSWKLGVCPMILYDEDRLGWFVVYSARALNPCPWSVQEPLDSTIQILLFVPLRILRVFNTYYITAYMIMIELKSFNLLITIIMFIKQNSCLHTYPWKR